MASGACDDGAFENVLQGPNISTLIKSNAPAEGQAGAGWRCHQAGRFLLLFSIKERSRNERFHSEHHMHKTLKSKNPALWRGFLLFSRWQPSKTSGHVD